MSSAVDLKTKEERDAELDRRVEAMRKKNEALVKRYQEIEEDKKKAEQEGIAITTPRKPRAHEHDTDRRKTDKENFTVTVDLSKVAGEKRVVNDWKTGTPRGRKTSEEGDSHGGPIDGPRGQNDSPRGQNDSPRGHSDSPRGQNDGSRGHSDSPRGQNDGSRGHSDSPRGQSDGPRGHSDGHSPPRRPGSGRVGRGGQRGGGERRQERREWQPRTPRDREGEPGESGGPRRGGRRGRGGEGRGVEGRGGEGRGRGEEGDGGTPGGIDKKSKEWEEKRRQNIEKMNEEMEKIAEYERGQRADGDKPIRNFLDDPRRSGPVPDIDRKDGSRRHVRNWGGLDFEKVKTGAELEREWTSRRPGPKGSMDMTMSMTGRERAEYLRWKKERDDIDEERLARHRNATGQWRREWDSQKTDGMFKEDPNAVADGVAPEQGGRRDDNKRPPKVPTFGDFLSQGRSQGPRGERGERMERGDRGDRGDRGRGRGRGQKPSYSMHDNRWEAEKEEEDREKEDRTKREEKPKKKEKEGEKRPPAQKAEEKNGEGEDDEEEWEDASDGDDEGVEDGSDSEPDEKKDRGREKAARSKDSSRMSPSAPPTTTASSGSPKEQRTPRPKVHIPPPPTAAQESPEGGKPLSPFALLDSHQPVTDWGEEMEMQSPRTSLGGESPLKPLSLEASPSQKKEEVEEESKTAEPHRDQETDVSPPPVETRAEPTVIVSEPQPEPVGPAPSEVREVAVTTDQDTPAAPSQADRPDSPPSPAVLEAETSASQPAGDKDDDTAPTGTDTAPIETAEEEEKSSEQTSSG